MIINENLTQYIYYITVVLFTFSVASGIINWLSVWQRKRYKLKRVLLYLFETYEGRLVLFGFENLLKISILVLFIFSVIYDQILLYFPFYVCFVYLICALHFIWKIINNAVVLPRITLKVGAVVVFTGIVGSFLFFIPLVNKFVWMVVVEKTVTIFIWMGMIIWSTLSDFFADVIINKAVNKRERFTKLTVIGIVGSYGKTETKEYLYHILSKKFNVLKTKINEYETEEVARTMVSQLSEKTDIFIVDMKAYEKGGIRDTAALIQPQIGIVTAMNDKYISIFKTQEKIVRSNLEMIEMLPKKGVVLLNSEKQAIKKLYSGIHRYIVFFSAQDSTIPNSVSVSKITVSRFAISFYVRFNGKNISHFTLHLLGKRSIEDIVPAIYLAWKWGMKINVLKNAVRSIKPIPHIMYPYIHNNVLHIDDTFHSHPASVHGVLEYLESTGKGKKILVLQPMEDLGRNAKKEHYHLAQEIGKVCDVLFLTNKNYIQSIKRGIQDSGRKCQVRIVPPKTIVAYIKSRLTKNDIVAYCGIEARNILSHLDTEEVIIV